MCGHVVKWTISLLIRGQSRKLACTIHNTWVLQSGGHVYMLVITTVIDDDLVIRWYLSDIASINVICFLCICKRNRQTKWTFRLLIIGQDGKFSCVKSIMHQRFNQWDRLITWWLFSKYILHPCYYVVGSLIGRFSGSDLKYHCIN